MKNRKTLKKLILGGLLLLTAGSVFAQTQKIHTLQVKNSSGTTTMNSDALIQMDSDDKGLLLPRVALTGANQVAPLTAHTEGMVVYNTATVAASGTGAAAIEAVVPGYYYNNGTKWVKISSSDENEWSYNPTTKQIDLVRSGTASFANKVYFDEKGNYINSDSETKEYVDLSTGVISMLPINKRASTLVRKASNMVSIDNVPGTITSKIMGENFLKLDSSDNLEAGKINTRNAFSASTYKESSNAMNYNWLYGGSTGVSVQGSGTDGYINGFAAGAYSNGSASVSGYSTALRLQNIFNSTGTANDVLGINNYVTQGANAGSINYLYGSHTRMRLSGNSPINRVIGSAIHTVADAGVSVANLYGYYYGGLSASNSGTFTNAYGMYLGDIEKATNNYAIYTNKGTVRFGDNVGIGTTAIPTEKLEVNGSVKITDGTQGEGKVLTSDATGKASWKTSENEWRYDSTTKQTNLVRSGTAPFSNKVYFDESGGYKNYDLDALNTYDPVTGATETVPITMGSSNVLRRNSFVIPASTGTVTSGNKRLQTSHLILGGNDVITGTAQSENNRLNTVANVTRYSGNNLDYNWIGGTATRYTSGGGGTDKYTYGISGSVVYAGNSTTSNTGYAVGGRLEQYFNSSGTANLLAGAALFSTQGVNGGAINSLEGLRINHNVLGTSNINNAYGVRIVHRGTGAATVTNYTGFHFNGIANTLNTNYTNAYGMYLGDIEKATNNYAIFTNKGTVRFGDNVGIGTTTAPTEKLEVVGNGKFTGTVSTTGVLTTSDKRFKQGITPLTSAMQTVNKLQPVSYTWSALGKKNGGDNKKHIGFIAQEVEKVLPSLVNTNAKGYKSVNYIEVIPVLTKALQEQQKENDDLKQRVSKLEAMVKKLLK